MPHHFPRRDLDTLRAARRERERMIVLTSKCVLFALLCGLAWMFS